MVQIEREIPAYWNAELSATPVMIPGSANGRMSRREIESRPKNRARCTPNAANEPRKSAMRVARVAALIERTKAERTWASWNATLNQRVVQLRIGHVSTFDPSKA